MSGPSGAAFSSDEVGEVIAAAAEVAAERERFERGVDEGLTYGDLRAIAAEVGVDERDLLAALARRHAADEPAGWRDRLRARRERARGTLWRLHVAWYAGMTPGLAIIDLATGGGLDWVWYPAGSWGGVLAAHGIFRWLSRRGWPTSPPRA